MSYDSEAAFLKEIMTKRILHPIWKCNETESCIHQLEKEGWRLERISGFRRFIFTKSTPMDTSYFLTYRLTKEKSTMVQTEMLLKNKFCATKIQGRFIEGLKTTSVYRMSGDVDLLERKIYRNVYLRRMLLQYLLMGILFLAIAVLGLILCCTFNGELFFNSKHLFLYLIGVFGAIVSVYNCIGIIHLRKEYRKFFQKS